MSEKPVLEAEIVEGVTAAPIVDITPQPLKHPPALIQTCACGKDGSPRAHGAIPDPRDPTRTLRPFSCQEVLEIAARVQADLARRPSLASRLVRRIVGGA